MRVCLRFVERTVRVEDLGRNFVVEFEGVNKNFTQDRQKVSGLKNITVAVAGPSIITIVGPSGAGKSTLLSLCNLLATADTGTVRIKGLDVQSWDIPELRQTVGMMFQTPVMFPGTVTDNIVLGPKMRGAPLPDAEKWLHAVGLSADLLERTAEELSGGQQQRIALARTLANDPAILLLDEVTSALDPAAVKDVESLITHIQKEQQLTVLWVTHNLDQARRVGDTTWLLVDGELVETAETTTFFEHPEQSLTQQFLAGAIPEKVGDVQ
jgi:putative ABC transport system ATP-binding protein